MYLVLFQIIEWYELEIGRRIENRKINSYYDTRASFK